MSYKGLSCGATALALALVFGLYFIGVQGVALSGGAVAARMVAAIVALALVTAVLEAGIAIVSRRRDGQARSDERDRLNAARGARNGFFVLLAVLWLAPLLALRQLPAVAMANLLLGLLVLGEIVHYASRAIYDARGR